MLVNFSCICTYAFKDMMNTTALTNICHSKTVYLKDVCRNDSLEHTNTLPVSYV